MDGLKFGRNLSKKSSIRKKGRHSLLDIMNAILYINKAD